MVFTSPAQQKAKADLMSTKCVCGEKKTEGNPFCRICLLDNLTPALRAQVICRDIGGGYEQAYERAVQFLREKGKIE